MTKTYDKLLIAKTRTTSLLLPTLADATRRAAEGMRAKGRVPVVEDTGDVAFPTIVTWQGRLKTTTPIMRRWLQELSKSMMYHDNAQYQLLNYIDDFMSTYTRQEHPHASTAEELLMKARRYAFDKNTTEMAERLARRGVAELDDLVAQTRRANEMLAEIDPALAKRLERELDTRYLSMHEDVLEALRQDKMLPMKAGIVACANDIAKRRTVTLLRRAMYRKVRTGDGRVRA